MWFVTVCYCSSLVIGRGVDRFLLAMKTIDIKSLLIGTLLTATIFLGIAATGKTDKWDDKQQWESKRKHLARERGWVLDIQTAPAGWEVTNRDDHHIFLRRRIK
jgi:hypothetical protein